MSTPLRPLDMGKLDFDGNRKRRRKKLLVRTLPLTVVLFMGAAWLVLPLVATNQADAAHRSGNFASAAQWLSILGTNTVFEPYIRPFNQAIVATNQKDFETADSYFTQAIAVAPDDKKCFIRVQSVLSTELAGDAAVVQKDRQQAIMYYTKALSEIASHGDCFTSYLALTLRIATKLSDLSNEIKNETYQATATTPEESKASAGNPSEQQLQALEKLQQQGQQAKQEAAQQSDVDYEYKGKTW